MLCAAGLLTLELATKLVPLNYGLKDATPYNVLFRGPNPVFIDLLSIEPRDPFDYVWMPYAQFMRTFMLPLQVNKYFNIPMADIFSCHRDGIEPEFVYHLTDILQKFMPAFFASVSIPVWLAKGHNQDDSSIYRKKTAKDIDRASYTLSSIFRGLQKRLQKTQKNRKRKSTWSHYESCEENYTGHEHELKATTVQDFLSKYKPKRVLDIGCNTGIFSVMAARAGASVTSIDFDPVCIGRLWEKAHELKLDILPLVIDIARPSPQIGWRNREHASFLERANQHFDCVLMLAVIHHLLVTERIPLSEIIELAVDLTTKYLVIEYIGPEDRMFKILTRGREHLYTFLDRDFFEQTCQKYFKIAHYQQIDKSSRWLYILIKK